MNNRFVIVVPFYNAEKWIGKSIKSVKIQDYDNFHCIVANDCSTDKSHDVCNEVIGSDPRFTLVKNSENLGPLGNAYNSALNHCKDKNDVVVVLDGDDFFYSKNTLKILNEYYNSFDCWMTYGSYINLSNKQVGKFSKQLPLEVINSCQFRNYEWSTSHLRSYKYGLLKKINKKDLLDENGDFMKAAGDLALMYPLLEMCGHKSKFIKEVLYIWNDLNELNEHKSKRVLQINCEKKIRNMAKYKKLEEL